MTRRAWIVFVAVLVGLMQTNHLARACSCAGPSGLDILATNAAVFAGKVMAIEYLEPDTDSSEPPIRVTFEVSEVWKGPVRSTATLGTVYNKFSCTGYFFREGHHYLVAAHTISGDERASDIAKLEGISLCGGTRLLSDANEDLKAFGVGRRPK